MIPAVGFDRRIIARPVMTRRPFAILLGCALASAVTSLPGRVSAEERNIDFDRRIGPLLVSRCFECHYGSKPKGGLDLSRRATATAGGESGNPASPHFNDQAKRYSTGELREVYFYRDQLKGHTQREYHPGS